MRNNFKRNLALGLLGIGFGIFVFGQTQFADAQTRPIAKTKANSNGWPASLQPTNRAFPNANSPCKVLGENNITANYLDHSATLVGCLSQADAQRLGGRVVANYQGVILVSVPNQRAATSPITNPPKPMVAIPSSADWREVAPDNLILMNTTKGRIIIELASDIAPNHAARIRELSRAKFYDGLNFHRVIEGFMAQGGDPKGDGTGGSNLPDLAGEFMFRRDTSTPYIKAMEKSGYSIGWLGSLPITSQADVWMTRTNDGKVSAFANHCPSVTSMARAADPNSANSQFFLMRDYTASLDRNYTVWGRALVGLDVIRALKTGEPVADPDKMIEVRVFTDIPANLRPRVFVEKPDAKGFQAKVQAAIAAKGAAFSNCDLMPTAQVIAPS